MFAQVLDEEGGPFTRAVEGLDDDALIEQLRHTERARRQLEAAQAATVHALAQRKVFRRDGHHSVYGLVRVVTNRPTREIHHLVRTGRLMAEHADVADALAAGTLGVAQAHDLAAARAHPRAGDTIGTVVTELVDQAITLPYPDYKLSVDRAVNLADADGADERAMRRHEGRDAYFHVSAHGLHGQIRGGVLAGEALLEIFEQYRKMEFDKDWAATQQAHGDQACAARMPRNEPQRRFDAFMNMATASISTPPGSQPPEPVVNIHGDRTTTATTLARAFGIEPIADPDAVPLLQRRCETARGTPIAPVELLAAMLAGHVRRVVCDSQHVVTDMGRKMRLFTGSTRVAAHMNLPRCIWPGCTLPASTCQTDHLTPWPHGGTTSPEDGGPCCARHNLFKHNHHYTITRDTQGRLHTWRPDGTEIT